MQHRHVYILAVMTASLPIAALAGTWIPPSQTAPSGNVEGPVWLQTGGPSPQTGNFSVSGIGTIGGNANVGGDLWANSNIYIPTGKTIRIDGEGVTTMLNFGNMNPSGAGFSANIQGDLTISGFGASDTGTLNVKRICLTQDPPGGPATCRTTWPAGGGAPADIWVDTTGDTMTGNLTINVGAGATGLSTNGGTYGGDFIGTANGVRAWGNTAGYFAGTGALSYGVRGIGSLIGVRGESSSAGGTGISGEATGLSGVAVSGLTTQDGSKGIYGNGGGAGSMGVQGYTNGAGSYGVYGQSNGANAYGVYGSSANGFGGYFYGGANGVVAANSAGSSGYLGTGGTGVSGFGTTAGVYGVAASAPSNWGALGWLGYGVYSASDIYSAGNKGVVLDALDRPLITRGHDAFTSGIYNGLGRWGLFMEPNYLTIGFPSGNGNFKISKYNADSTKTDLLTVTEAGKVGIGTTAPDYNLTVSGAGTSFMNIKDGTRNILMGVDAGGASISVLSAHNLLFKTSNVEKMRIMDSTGYVGIGTTAPANMLTVQGNGTGVANIGTNVCGGNYTGISLNGSSMSGVCSTSGYNILSSPTDQTLIFNRPAGNAMSFREGNTAQLTIAAGGNVGIGTAAPTYKLQISTDSAAKPGTNTWTVSSDGRLKTIEGPFTRGLEAIERLDPVYYRYRDGNALNLPTDKIYVGFVAQDVKDVIPEAIGKDTQGYYTMNSDAITYAMLNAIKELKAENDALKARVEALEKK